MRYYSLLTIILVQTIFNSCGEKKNETNEQSLTPKVAVKKNSEINVDSILKNTETDSLIFLNYPQYSSKEVVNSITLNNGENGKLRFSKNGQLCYDYSTNKESPLTFEVTPSFYLNKLFAIELSTKTISYNKQIKEILDNKYGIGKKIPRPKDFSLYIFEINQISEKNKYLKNRNIDVDSFLQNESEMQKNVTQIRNSLNNNNGSDDFGNVNYIYKNKNKIIVLGNSTITYYTSDTYNYMQKLLSSFENVLQNEKGKYNKNEL